MGTNWQRPGINHVGEYQASGHTFVVTGSANIIKLKYVASSITVSSVADQGLLTIYDSSHAATDFRIPSGSCASYKGKFLTFKLEPAVETSALISLTNITSASYIPPSGSQLHYI